MNKTTNKEKNINVIISEKKLEKLSMLNLTSSTHNNGGKMYIIDNNTICKIFRSSYFFQEEVERNVEFQINNHVPNSPTIYNKLFINNTFSGYIMEYIPNSTTFRNAIGNKIDLDLKLKSIQDIYRALKYLHSNNIFLGDIHLDNFLISPSGGHIIDLDYIVFPGDEYKFKQCYLIKPNNNAYKINISSRYTDNIKTMLSCLSLLLNIDLESFISHKDSSINLEEIYNKIIIPLNNNILNDYFIRILNQENVEYFSDFISSNKSIKR